MTVDREISPGIYIAYEERSDPYFAFNIETALAQTRKSATMQELLKRIKLAKPAVTLGTGRNVQIQPPLERKLSVSLADPSRRAWSLGSKTAVQEISSENANKKGTGSACWLYFTNREWQAAPMHITLAHELIHCMHALEGTMNSDNQKEEYATVGIHGYEGDEITENRIRQELNVPLRAYYFATDPKDYKPTVK